MRLRYAALFGCLLLAGCPGVRFANIPQFNKELPEDFKRRVLWNQTDIFKYNLQELAGHVIYAKGQAGEYDRGPRYVKPDKYPPLKIVESGEVYKSKIDKGASAEGSYLAFAAKLSGDQIADVAIIDTAQVFIPYEDIPMDALLEEAKKPAPPETTKRYYIQAVLLATVVTQYGAKIKADASGVVGNAFGAKGNIYNEEQTVSRDVRISLLLIDLDRLVKVKAMPGPPEALTTERLVKAARADGFSVQRISGLE
jgi:hypothetical protein